MVQEISSKYNSRLGCSDRLLVTRHHRFIERNAQVYRYQLPERYLHDNHHETAYGPLIERALGLEVPRGW